MSFSVIQTGASLRFMDEDGVVSAALTLPTGVTLREDIPARFVVSGRQVILVNTPSKPLTIDATGTVRLLCPTPPRLAPTLTGTASGGLTGTYNGLRYTFVVEDENGSLISESDFSPASGSITIAAKLLTASSLDISADQISGRRVYRPTTQGAVNFQWVDLDGNVLTSVSDDLPDAGLSLVAAPVLGTPPDLTLIAEFRDRVWGVGRIDVDNLRYSEVGRAYAWPADNVFPIPSVGSDYVGIRGLMPRRESLGIGRENQLLMLTGTDDSNFAVAKLSQNCGVISQETVSVYRDVAYFLWQDGVYQWGDDGIQCLSDGKVRSWFTKDDIFNRGRFQYAFGHVDPIRFKYRLFLNRAGSETALSWVEYDLKDGTWWGPHLTNAFTPTTVFTLLDGELVPRPTFGSSDGDLYRETETRTDGTSTPIAENVLTKRFSMDEPDMDKYWGELTMIGEAQDACVVDISCRVGELNSTTENNLQWDMTQNRERLARVGTGKHVELELSNEDVGQDVQIYGIEIAPVHLLGRR